MLGLQVVFASYLRVFFTRNTVITTVVSWSLFFTYNMNIDFLKYSRFDLRHFIWVFAWQALARAC